ncbi:MAG TPA: BatA domain-containing protein [Bryobacteraceae bacterium]|nr:BatA domain-containing protein [Bryobacteraceae bacterium]
MGFFSPWFLGGLIAVGLPIWLHLLKRHKTDPQMFPSLMFFEHREQSSVQHRRLDYILLFILRTLMLVLLALLFANPFIRRNTPKGNGQKIVVVAVDRSFSMRTKEGTTSRLELAKAEALRVLSGLPPAQKAQVVALADTLQAMTQQTTDPGELRGAVSAIKESDARASFGELARYLRTLSESTKTPLEVHLISDLQKSGMPPGFTDLRLDEDTALNFHTVGKVQPNWAVETVIAPQHVYDPKRARISATVAGFSAPAATRTVTLLMNGKTIQSKSVNVPENGRGTAEFTGLDAASYGFNKCEIRIDSSDSLPADDRYAFSVERTDPKKVAFVDDGRRPQALEFFRAALNATEDSAYQLEPLRPEVAATANLSNYAVVVLNNLGQLPQGLEQSLERYVTAGGSLFESIGPGSVALPRAPVLDEAIEGTRYASREGERFFTVSDVDAGHDVVKSVERFDGVRIYLAVNVGTTKSRVLARLSNGTPLVLERKVGEGKVLAFTSTFDADNNDMPKHGAWVPFVQKSVAYLGGGGSTEQPANFSVGEYVELRTGNEKGAQAEVQDPDGQRVLSLEESAQARNFQLTREGFYEVRTAGGKRSQVAAHANRLESDLAVIPQDSLDLWKATGASASSTGAGQGTGGEANTTPWSLSPIILLLLLGVALAESVIADRYLRPQAQSQETKAA